MEFVHRPYRNHIVVVFCLIELVKFSTCSHAFVSHIGLPQESGNDTTKEGLS